MAKYESPFSADHRTPIFIDSKDPRAQKDKLEKNIARHGREIFVVENKESIKLDKYYNRAKFVTVSLDSNVFAYSFDGAFWNFTTAILPVNMFTTPTGTDWYSVTYGNRKFLAISAFGKFAYSFNGINWNFGNMPLAESWYAVTYGNGKFVAVGNFTSAYSYDGITWTINNIPTANWRSVTYGNGKFVAVSFASLICTAYSNDGITWSAGIFPSNDGYFSAVYGNGKFVAVGPFTRAYSYDGITWITSGIPQNSQSANGYWYSVTYGNEVFISGIGVDCYYYSTDGILWNVVCTAPFNSWYAVTYGNGMFVMVGYHAITYSTDGFTWTLSSLEVTPNTSYFYSVASS